MERYTIRILYRDSENPGKLVGVVEAEGDAGKRGFVGLPGLWNILSHAIECRGGNGWDSGRERPERGDDRRGEIFRYLRE